MISPGTASMRAAAARRACPAQRATHPVRIIRRARREASSAMTAWTTIDDASTDPHAPLILRRSSASRSSGQFRDDDYDVLEGGVVVGRIFCLDAIGPQGRPWT